MAELTLADLLLKLLTEWRSITRPRQRDLLRLCNQKYAELEKTHISFMSMLREAYDLVDRTMRHGGQGNEDFLEAFRKLENQRYDGRQARLAQYEQARLYAGGAFANQSSIIKAVPEPVADAVKTMMESYVHYFQMDGMYAHELGHVFSHIDNLVRGDALAPQDVKAIGKRILDMNRNSRSVLELDWIRFSRDYYRAYAIFADHGIFAADADKS